MRWFDEWRDRRALRTIANARKNGFAVIDDDRGWTLKTPCWECRHHRSGRTCAAFPDGIPKPIWVGDHDHRTSYRGDRGIRFEPWTQEEIEARRQRIADQLQRGRDQQVEGRDRQPADELSVR